MVGVEVLRYARRVRGLLSTLLFIGLQALAGAAQALEVRWAIIDGPPFHTRGAPEPTGQPADLGDGLLDALITGLAREAPELRHRFVVMSRPRMWRAMQAGEPICYADAFRTPERLRWAYLTPATLAVPLVLVTRKGLLGAGTDVSLADVLARPDLHGAFEPDRSYGEGLDTLIRQAGPQARSMNLPDSPVLLRMLEAGRMDYLVEYPPTVHYFAQRLQPPPELDVYALREAREPTPSYIACTRSPWGRQVVQALDRAVRRWAATPDAPRSIVRWLPPEVAQREAGGVEAFFRERARVSRVE